MTPEAGEDVAIRALAWIASHETAAGTFLSVSGASAQTLRAGAGDPQLLSFVLDFLLSDEALLLDCMAALDLPPEAAMSARRALPGGDAPHFT